jgi:hypothetical protein
MSSIELKKRFEAGQLPEVKALIAKPRGAGVYTDKLGHPNRILTSLSELVWLACIYKVDLTNYEWDSGYTVDLRAIAQGIAAGS